MIPNQTYSQDFYQGEIGLLQADFSVRIKKAGTLINPSVVITEGVDGFYNLSFALDDDNNVTYQVVVFKTTEPEIFSSDSFFVSSDANLARKYQTNRAEYDVDNELMTVYEDDATTVLETFETDQKTFRRPD